MTPAPCEPRGLAARVIPVAHVCFNLVLPLLFVIDCANWHLSGNESLQKWHITDVAWWTHAYVGTYHWLMIYGVITYMVLDGTIILLFPRYVQSKSIPVVIVHHLLCATGAIVTGLRPRESGYTLACGLFSELNTTALIVRRTIVPLSFPGKVVVRAVNSTIFYLSWVAIRLVLHPFLALVVYRKDYMAEWERTGTPFNVVLVCYPIAFLLLFMNAQWTVQLATNNYKRAVKALTRRRSAGRKQRWALHA